MSDVADVTARSVLQVGQVVQGRYLVEKVLAEGGMGLVVAARHIMLDQLFAMKVMLPAARQMRGMTERFLREAQAAARLNSVHVVRVADLGVLEDDAPFMVMELLEGKDLGAVLYEDGVRPVPEAVNFVLQACEAVAEAHSLGIVHRDLKPANLFATVGIDGSIVIKVLDFGISKMPAMRGSPAVLTQGVGGSPTYMAPEQMERPREVDARADIWSFGISIYELLTGQVPFEAESLIALHKLMTTVPARPPSSIHPGVPPELDAVILRCLKPNPEERYNDVVSLAEALSPFGGEGAGAQVGCIVRIATGMFREQRLAELTHGRRPRATRAGTW